jgi:nucleoside-diphosphate-sugar epimerase
MSKVFLTGGSGFLGRYLIAALKDNGAEVFALARSAASAETVARRGALPIAGDLDGDGSWRRAVADCDMVLHAAALLVPYAPYKEFYGANVEGTRRLLTAAKSGGVRRFVQVGAAAVVMGAPRHMRDVDETAPLQTPAFAPYIATKSIAEREIRAASREGFDALVVRPPAIWGQGSHLAASLKESLSKGQFALIDGGRAEMSTCHAANVASGAIAALDRGKGGEAYFLTDADTTTFRDFAASMVGVDALKGVRSFPFWAAWQIGGLQQQLADWRLLKNPAITRGLLRLIGKDFTISIAKARRDLGWTPKVTRAQGAAR